MPSTTSVPTLRSLADQELALCHHVQALAGTIDARHEQLIVSTISAEYLQVHRAYLHLAAHAPADATRLEALKRLIFLAWYSLNEPPFNSGLNYYDPDLQRSSYALLEVHLATTAPLDRELRWMLDHYAAFWDDNLLPAITGLPLPTISAFIAAKNPAVYLVPERQLPPGTMAHRGQLGLYWQSLGVEQTP